MAVLQQMEKLPDNFVWINKSIQMKLKLSACPLSELKLDAHDLYVVHQFTFSSCKPCTDEPKLRNTLHSVY